MSPRGRFTRPQVEKLTTLQRKLPPSVARSDAGAPHSAGSTGAAGGARCVLVVGDDPDVLPLTVYYLAANGHRILTARSAAEGLAIARAVRPDLVIVGARLPDLPALELLRRLRVPDHDGLASAPHEVVAVVLLLTGEGDEAARDAHRLEALALGADDVVTAPLNVQELVLRAAAILRRVHSAPSGPRAVFVLGASLLRLDVDAHQVMVEEVPVQLTRSEFGILQALAEHAGRLRTRAQLSEALSGEAVGRTDRSRAVDIQVSRLRAKLGIAGDLIETVRGEGYRLRKPPLPGADPARRLVRAAGRALQTPQRTEEGRNGQATRS